MIIINNVLLKFYLVYGNAQRTSQLLRKQHDPSLLQNSAAWRPARFLLYLKSETRRTTY